MNTSEIYTYNISNATVDSFNDVLEQIKTLENYQPVKNTHTHNGFQTHNIRQFIADSILQEINEKTNQYLKSVVKNCAYYEYNIDYIHLVHYNTGGWQEGHTHKDCEDHSFILYLNDSDGCTKFYEGAKTVTVEPKRGKIVFFGSDLYHEGQVCTTEKKIVVGAIRFIYKVWKTRT